MFKILVVGILFFFQTFTLLAEQENCYVAVDNSGSYDQLTVTTIALTMLRQFVDPKIQPAPTSGFSNKACIYQVNVLEQEAGIKVFILGENISDYGKSQLRGDPGLEQAILRSILKSLNEQTATICKKYGSALETECQGKSSASKTQEPNQPQMMGDSQNRRIPPDCQRKPGIRLPEKCKMFYEQGFGNNPDQQRRPIPPDCRKKPGVRLPEKCKMFHEQRFENNQDRKGRPIPPDCLKKPGVKLPDKCRRFYDKKRPPKKDKRGGKRGKK